ncbi:MAG: rhodanese-like domain-containing protein [Bacteroidota bacterium]|nr:rhodanese-like domain-containing protein [Bacteroidota bacterium]
MNRLILFYLIVQISATYSCAQKSNGDYKNIDQHEFLRLMTQKDVVILDLRTPDEYNNDHIPNSKLVDYSSPNFNIEIDKLDKSKKYLVYCGAGGRSSKAAALMGSKGFNSIYNLNGGFSSWSGPKE